MSFNRLMPIMKAALRIVLGAAARRRGNSPPKPAFRPRLEILEDRLAPATATWGSLVLDPFANGLWLNVHSWRDGYIPAPGDDVVFPADGLDYLQRNSVNNILNLRLRSITAEDNYSVFGNAITLDTGGIILRSRPSNDPAVTNGDLALQLNIGLNGGADATPINIGSGCSLAITGIVSGVGGLTIDHADNLFLNAANTYTGRTTVAQGTLAVVNVSALGADIRTGGGNETVVASGATLRLATSGVNESLELAGTLAVDSTSGTTRTWDGPIILIRSNATVRVSGYDPLTLSGPIGGLGLDKVGAGRLILSGANNYVGETRVMGGFLRIRDSLALGQTLGGTIVSNGAILEMEGDLVVAGEKLFFGLTRTAGNGALRQIAGGCNWFGDIAVNNSFIANVPVEDHASYLRLGGVISGTANWEKRGAGTLELAGDLPNTFSGTLAVLEGRLTLNKVGERAVTGPLIIGDGVGGAFADEVMMLHAFQIADTAAVTINSSGLLRLNGLITSIGPLTMTGGMVFDLPLSSGTLFLNGDVTATSAPDGTPSRIEGTLNLNGVTRNFTIPDGPGAVDLVINNDVYGVDVGLTKRGPGTLQFPSNNIRFGGDYSGNTSVLEGRLLIDRRQTNSPVVVSFGATLGGSGTVGPLLVGGTLDPGTGATLHTLHTNPNVRDLRFVSFGTFLARPTIGSGLGFVATGSVDLGSANLQVAVLTGGSPPFFDALLPTLGVPTPIIIAGAGYVGTFANGGGPNGDIFTAAGPIGPILFRITYAPNMVFLTRISGPAFQNRTVTSPINEAGIATVTGTITTVDPSDRFFLDVKWGDGSRTETYTVKPKEPRTLSVTHRYVDDGNFTIHLLWRDQRGAQNTGTLSVTVNNVPPMVSTGTDATLRRGATLVRVGSFADPGADSWTAMVDYGDGTGAQPLALNSAHRFTLKHRYDTPGTYTVSVTVADDDGGIATDSFVVTVLPVASAEDWFFAHLSEWDEDRLNGRDFGELLGPR